LPHLFEEVDRKLPDLSLFHLLFTYNLGCF